VHNTAGSIISSFVLIVSIHLISEHCGPLAMASSPTLANDSTFSTYQNSSFGVKMQYPSDWKKIEDFRGSWFRNFNESVNMRVEIVPNGNRTLDQLTENQTSLIEHQFPLQKMVESKAVTIGENYNAHKIVFTFPEEPRNLDAKFKEMKVWTISGNRGYIISYFTPAGLYDTYLPIAETVVDSLRITPVNEK